MFYDVQAVQGDDCSILGKKMCATAVWQEIQRCIVARPQKPHIVLCSGTGKRESFAIKESEREKENTGKAFGSGAHMTVR